ncbi:MAG: hypothetical protein J6M34_01455 [Clostridia bacterium]|nr:hypothetical protein [Clostridia bacterium]
MWEWIIENLSWICPLIITILFSVLNVIVAKSNLKIAKQQSKMQNDGFCFQLYERRWGVYESIDKILCSVGREAKVCDEDIAKFHYASHNARFLFDQDMADFCEKTRDLLIKLRTVGKQVDWNINHQSDDSNHANLCEKEAELISIISSQQQQLKDIVEKYISFSEYKVKK